MEGSLFFMEDLDAHGKVKPFVSINRSQQDVLQFWYCLVLGVILSRGGKWADKNSICGPVWMRVCNGLVCNLKTYFPIASSRYGSAMCEDYN